MQIRCWLRLDSKICQLAVNAMRHFCREIIVAEEYPKVLGICVGVCCLFSVVSNHLRSDWNQCWKW